MRRLDDDALRALLLKHAPLSPVPLVPSLRAYRADDELPLWQALEDACGARVEAPFFAVTWPGAQAVARGIEDGAIDVTGRQVLELGCGSGLASVAAARAGAVVTATDVDDFALQATRLLAEAHGVGLATARLDVLDDVAVAAALAALPEGAIVVAADVVYNRGLGLALSRVLEGCRRRGLDVVVADSGRPFFDPAGLAAFAVHEVPVPVAVEGQGMRRVTSYRFA